MFVYPDYKTETDFREAVAAGERPHVFFQYGGNIPIDGLSVVEGPHISPTLWRTSVILKDGKVVEVR